MGILELIKGDITEMEVDAIVNAANKTLLGGGGVDGAIHRKAGPKLLEECRKLNGCETGEAKITKGYNLKAKYVIHTVGPVYNDGKSGESRLLYNSFYNSLKLAKDYGIKTIAFPAISTGVYGYPKEDAAKVSLGAIYDFLSKEGWFEKIFIVLYDEKTYKIFKNVFEKNFIGE
uniref:O-acetyl-ADP-ribose deacetylase n=1 Tax=candidate division WOR-3 bacterium TaxID=2052148 RepID=A0A7C3J561_UNCW3